MQRKNMQQGITLEPLWREDLPYHPRKHVLAEGLGSFPLIASQRMIRIGPRKYIFNYGGQDEVYDLTADPHELINLAQEPQRGSCLLELRLSMAFALKENQDPVAKIFACYFSC